MNCPPDNEEAPVSAPVMEAIVTLCDGNPGAISVCLSIMANMPVLFPRAFTELSPTFVPEIFNEAEFYGRDIFLLWKQICTEDLAMVVAFALAMHHGLIEPKELRTECDNLHGGLTSKYSTEPFKKKLLNTLSALTAEFNYVKRNRTET